MEKMVLFEAALYSKDPLSWQSGYEAFLSRITTENDH